MQQHANKRNLLHEHLQAEVLDALRGKLRGPPGTFAILVAMPMNAITNAVDSAPIGVIEVYQDGSDESHADMGAGPDEVGIGWLGSMAVTDSYKRQGVGSALVRASDEIVRSWRYKRTGLHVFADNEAAVQMYERCGFVRRREATMVWAYWLTTRRKLLMARVHTDSPESGG